VFATAGE
jgi:WD40 repeat protein